MAKSMSADLRYGGSLEEAWAKITNPAYQEGKLAALGAKDITVSINENADGSATIVLERDNPVTGAAAKIAGPWVHVIETQTWGAPAADGSRTGKQSTEFKGQPIQMGGDLTLSDKGGAVVNVSVEVKASIPLVGGKIESNAIDETKAAIAGEEKFAAGFSG